MNQLTKISMHRVDIVHKVDEWQDTLYTYDYRGLVKTEVNAKGDGKYLFMMRTATWSARQMRMAMLPNTATAQSTWSMQSTTMMPRVQPISTMALAS